MSSDRDATLGDYFALQRGNTYKSRLLGEPGPVLLGLASIHRNGGFRDDNLRTYGGASDERVLVGPGELYVSLKDVTQAADLLGAVARFPEGHGIGRLTQDTVKLVPRRPDVPLDFLYWVMRTPNYRRYCRSRATGTTNLGLPRDDFLSYPVAPFNGVRERLVRVLEVLEDKIALNRRLTHSLDDLMRLQVVKACKWSDLKAPVSGLGRFQNGGAYTKGASGTGRMVVRIADLRSGPGSSTVYNDITVPEDRTVKAGDILFSWSGSLLVHRWFRDEAIVNQHIFKVIPRDDLPSWLVYCCLHEALPTFQGIAADKATTMGHIKRHHLDDVTVLTPSSDLIRSLDPYLSALWELALTYERQTLTLVDLRDTLLPKLISGELRVDEAERLAEDVA